MKKKVLFALIALFSFVSAWAASGDAVKVGDKIVVLSSRFITGTEAPTFVSLPDGWYEGTGVYAYDPTNKKYVSATIEAEDFGTFFLKITKGDDVLYVPFQKGVAGVQSTGETTETYTPNDFAYIYNEASWNLSFNNDNGGLKAYYAKYDGPNGTQPYREDMYNTVANRRSMVELDGHETTEAAGGVEAWNHKFYEVDADGFFVMENAQRCWQGAINANYAKYPWIAMNTGTKAVRPLFKYNYGDLGAYEPDEVMPWGEYKAITFGVASLAEEFKNNSFLLPETNYGGNDNWHNTKGTTCAFDITKFSVDLFPEIAAFALAPSVAYNGDNTQGPGFSLAGWDPEVLGLSVEATIINDKTGLPVESINGVGTYYYSINFYTETSNIKTYKLTTPIKSTTFDVTGRRVVINAARTSKKYGAQDPAPNWAFDWASSLAEGDTEADITDFLVFKRSTGNEGEDVREYNYFIDYSDAYQAGECDYDIVILQNTSLLVIEPKAIDIYVTDDTKSKKYNGAEPTFKYVVDNALTSQLPFAADVTRASGTPNATTDLITKITRAAGETIEDGPYAFTATPYLNQYGNANYIVNVKNAFSIVPTDETGGVTVTFNPNSFVYDGTKMKPAPIVKDGEVTLTADDYEIDTEFGEEGYQNNKNAGTATCQIKLKGHYVATGDASKKQGTFTITKRPLTVYAISYTAEPDAYGYDFVPATGDEKVGFVTGEDETNADGFTKPDAPIVSKGASIEQDVYALVIKKTGWSATNYEITAKDGILALNNKPVIYARPDAKTQEYTGTVDEELTFATYTDRDYADAHKMATNPVTAVVGQPVYVIAKEDPTNANAGAYDITLRGATVLKDYNVVYDDLTDGYVITRKQLTLKGINVSKIYGDADPTFDALVYDGETAWTREQMDAANIKNNNTDNNGISYYVGVGQWYNNRWNHLENVGEYDVVPTVTRATGGNYEIITPAENGKFTINKFAAKVKADDKTKQFGQADPDFTVTITDNNENAEGHTIGTAVSNAFVTELNGYWRATREDAGTDAGEAVGDHTISVAAPRTEGNEVSVPANFDLTFENGKLTISPAQIAVLAKDQYVDYALDYNKKINPYDVIVVTPTEILVWQKSTQEGLSNDQKAINEKIQGLVKLTVKEGKNKLGGNEDAFELNILNNSYVLATEDVVLSGDYVYGGATIKNGFKNAWLTIYALETIPLENAELAAALNEDPDEVNANPSILQQVLNDHKAEGVKVNVKLPARKMDADEWYAWVLPFAVKPSALFSGDYFGYGAAEILDANKSVGGNVVFSLQIAKEIPANTPFIVKVEKDIDAATVNSKVFNNVTIDNALDYVNANPSTVAGGVSFVGLYWDYKGPKANERYLAKVTPTDAPEDYVAHRDFWPGGPNSSKVTLVRTNAFLQFASAEAAARATIYIENEDGTLTTINGVNADAEVAYGEGWYTITGVKLTAEPTVSGTYIYNGKKVYFQAK